MGGECSKDEYIEELVIAGPKSYAYRFSADNVVSVCKQKGITICRADEALVDVGSLKQFVLNAGK